MIYHERQNGWVFESLASFPVGALVEGHEEVSVPAGHLLPILSVANPQPTRQRFVPGWDDLRYLWSLYDWSSGFGAADRKLLALLINHHAIVNRVRGTRAFGNAAARPVVDLFGVGSTSPRLWILGEQGNRRAKSFPMPFGTAAGAAMLWPFLHPWSTRLSNCLQPLEQTREARRRLRHEWHQLGEPPVLLLGNVAASVWTESKAVMGYLEHPQYIYRFHHDKCPEWTHQLTEFEAQSVAREARV